MATVTGNLQTLIGGAPRIGRIWFKLSRPNWDTATGEIFAPEYVEAVGDSETGAFTIDLQETDVLDEDSVYYAILKYRDTVSGADMEWTLGTFALPTGGPYELSDILVSGPFNSVPQDILTLVLAAATSAETAATQAETAATQAEAAATSAETAAAALLSQSDAALYDFMDDRGVLLIAHRGFRTLYPQNTMLALSNAARIADAIECDVQVSADGTTWLFHDTTVDALTDGTGTFTALSDATIAGLSFDTFGLDADLVGMVKIPKFSTLLQFARRNTVPIFPEIKAVRTDADVDLICDEVIAAYMDRWTVLQSFSWTHTLRALNYDARIRCGYLNTDTTLAGLQYAVNTLAPFNGRGWLLTSYASLLAEPSAVAYARNNGVPIAAYTVTTQAKADYLQGIGVRAIMADVALTGVK